MMFAAVSGKSDSTLRNDFPSQSRRFQMISFQSHCHNSALCFASFDLKITRRKQKQLEAILDL